MKIAKPVITVIEKFERGPAGINLSGVKLYAWQRVQEIKDAKNGIRRGVKLAIAVGA